MSPTEVENIARQFIQAWTADRRDVVDEWAASDLTVSYPHFPDDVRGPAAFKEMLAQTHRFFPDLTVEVSDVLVEGTEAAVEWAYRGTFQEGEMFGVEADGQAVEVAGMTIYRIEDGQVQSERGVVDNFGLMMQLGAGPGASGGQ